MKTPEEIAQEILEVIDKRDGKKATHYDRDSVVSLMTGIALAERERAQGLLSALEFTVVNSGWLQGQVALEAIAKYKGEK